MTEYTQRETQYNNNLKLSNDWTHWSNQINQLEATINRHNFKQLEITLQQHEEKQQLTQKVEYWTNIQQIKPIFLEKKLLNEQISKLRIIVYQLNTKLDTLKQNYSNYTTTKDKIDHMASIINTYKKAHNATSYIIEMFNGFKNWLYTKIIIPKLLLETNRIVEAITETNIYELTANINPNNTFTWFIRDTKNQTIIEKAGGFRKFIFGLAIRISLSYLGASSVMCKQLFIDEGFVSADADNIEKIPDFIKGLIPTYDSVLLVSHLDTIKDSGDINVNIRRTNDRLSQIQFGSSTNITNIKPKIKLNPIIISNQSINLNPIITLNQPINSDPQIISNQLNSLNHTSIECSENDNITKTILIDNICGFILKNGKTCSNKPKNNKHCWRHII